MEGKDSGRGSGQHSRRQEATKKQQKKQQQTRSKPRRTQRTDHDLSSVLEVQRFASKRGFACWRCADEPKEARALCHWHLTVAADGPALRVNGADDADGGVEGEEEGVGVEGEREGAAEGRAGEEARGAPTRPNTKTICLACYGHLLSVRQGRGQPLARRPPSEGGPHEAGSTVLRLGYSNGGEERAGQQEQARTPTRSAPRQHKRREKKHARVSYAHPKGPRGGRVAAPGPTEREGAIAGM